MWACNRHLKKVLTVLDTPHVSKTPYSIKCSFCDHRAEAKIYYTHQVFQFKKDHKNHSDGSSGLLCQ